MDRSKLTPAAMSTPKPKQKSTDRLRDYKYRANTAFLFPPPLALPVPVRPAPEAEAPERPYARRLYNDLPDPREWANMRELVRRWPTALLVQGRRVAAGPLLPAPTIAYRQRGPHCFGTTAVFLTLRAYGFTPATTIRLLQGPAAGWAANLSASCSHAPALESLLSTKSALFHSVRSLAQRAPFPHRSSETPHIPLDRGKQPLLYLRPIGILHHQEWQTDQVASPQDLEVNQSWFFNRVEERASFPQCPQRLQLDSLQEVLMQGYREGRSPPIQLEPVYCMLGACTVVQYALPFIYVEYCWRDEGRRRGHAIGIDLSFEHGIGVFDPNTGWTRPPGRGLDFLRLEAYLVNLWHSHSGTASRTPDHHGVRELNLPRDRGHSIRAYQLVVQMLSA